MGVRTPPATGRFKGSLFLTFETAAAAGNAIKLNGKALAGKPMVVERAGGGAAAKPEAAEPKAAEPGTSVFVSNLPPPTKRKNLRELFAECGDIRRVKMLEPAEVRPREP